MISGFVLQKPGEKISKSKIMRPITDDADRKHFAGCDALLANSKLGTDTFFHEEELKISKRF